MILKVIDGLLRLESLQVFMTTIKCHSLIDQELDSRYQSGFELSINQWANKLRSPTVFKSLHNWKGSLIISPEK